MDEKQASAATPPKPEQPKRPNDVGTLQVDAFVKVFDPNNKEVFVEKRA